MQKLSDLEIKTVPPKEVDIKERVLKDLPAV